MKKLCFFLIAVFLVAGAAFAQEDEKKDSGIEKIDLEVNVGFPVHWTNGVHDEYEDKYVTANTAIGVAVTFNSSKTFGFILDMDFSVGAKLAGNATSRSETINLSGANLFVGPLFYLYNAGALRVPIGVGLHFNYFSDDIWVPYLDGDNGVWRNQQEFQLGVGLSIGLQYHFEGGIYIFSRTYIAIDFLRLHAVTGSVDSDLCIDAGANWLVKPSLGIGIKF